MNNCDFLNALESGELRAAEKDAQGQWQANAAVKNQILECFCAGKNIESPAPHQGFVDKDNLPARHFTVADHVRMVPGGTSVRRGAYVAPGVIIMPPSYINVGAFVDEGTMVDSHVLVGSCAQIGKHVHLSTGVQIGGVLEPVGQIPVIIEDHAFVGAGVLVVEGMIIGAHSVIAPGVCFSAATPIYDIPNQRELAKGIAIPPGSVVVPGTRPINKCNWAKGQGLQLATPIIIKYRDDRTDTAVCLEDVLRMDG